MKSIIAVLVIVIMLAAAVWLVIEPSSTSDHGPSGVPAATAGALPDSTGPDAMATAQGSVGTISAADATAANAADVDGVDKPDGLPPFADYGTLPRVAADANPQVAAVAEAYERGDAPERLSPVFAEAFDREAYERDPEAWIARPTPGRVFQTAQPGPEVPRLRHAGERMFVMRQGEQVWLETRAPADAPVTFTSFDAGSFDNELTTITVRADERGLARARFTATSGLIDNVNLLAGCPLASGQLKFLIVVQAAAAEQQPVAQASANE